MGKMLSGIKSAGIRTLNTGMGMLLPLLVSGAGLLGGDKDKFRRAYINLNNLSASYWLKERPPVRTLLLLPHCMQNKDCSCNITENIENCRRCGGCMIGESADEALKYGVNAVVAKGGTAAREMVKEHRPEFIIAVACERELISGMCDIGRIPVMGIVNRRPDGYCTNTTVEILELGDALKKYIAQESHNYIK